MQKPQLNKVSKSDLIWLDIENEEGTFIMPRDCKKIIIRNVSWDNTTANTNPFIFYTPSIIDQPWFVFSGLLYSANVPNTYQPFNNKITFDNMIAKGTMVRYRIANPATSALATATGLDGYLLIIAEFISYV